MISTSLFKPLNGIATLIAVSLMFNSCTGDNTRQDAQPTDDQEDSPSAFNYESHPVSVFKTVDAPDPIAVSLHHESVIGYTYIRFDETVWSPEKFEQGSLFVIHLPDDLVLDARVHRIQKHADILTISARLEEPRRGSVNLTQDSGRVIGRIELYGEQRVFHIRHDGQAGMSYLAEVDPGLLDVIPGEEPLQGR